jgi:hypothetical protein
MNNSVHEHLMQNKNILGESTLLIKPGDKQRKQAKKGGM